MGYPISSTTNSSSLTMTMTFSTSSSTTTATVTATTSATSALAALSTSDPILFLTHRKALRAKRASEHCKRRDSLLLYDGSDDKFTAPRLSCASSSTSSSSSALYKENIIAGKPSTLKGIGRGETYTRSNPLPSSLPPSSSARLSLPASPRPTRPAPLPPNQFTNSSLTNTTTPISASSSTSTPELNLQLKTETTSDADEREGEGEGKSESSIGLNFVKSPTSSSFPISLSHPFRPRPRVISRSRSPSSSASSPRHAMRNGNNISERTWTYIRKPSPLCPSSSPSSLSSHTRPYTPSVPRTLPIRSHTKPHPRQLRSKSHHPNSSSHSKSRSSRDPCLLRLAIMTNMRRSEVGRQVLAMGARRAVAMFEAMEELERICGDGDADEDAEGDEDDEFVDAESDVDGDGNSSSDGQRDGVNEATQVKETLYTTVDSGYENDNNQSELMIFETHKPWARWDNFQGSDCEDDTI